MDEKIFIFFVFLIFIYFIYQEYGFQKSIFFGNKEGFTPQNTVLVFNTNDLESRWAKVTSMPGIEIIQEPTYTEYPSYDGSSVIKVSVSKFYDPDGNLVELNQILNAIH